MSAVAHAASGLSAPPSPSREVRSDAPFGNAAASPRNADPGDSGGRTFRTGAAAVRDGRGARSARAGKRSDLETLACRAARGQRPAASGGAESSGWRVSVSASAASNVTLGNDATLAHRPRRCRAGRSAARARPCGTASDHHLGVTRPAGAPRPPRERLPPPRRGGPAGGWSTSRQEPISGVSPRRAPLNGRACARCCRPAWSARSPEGSSARPDRGAASPLSWRRRCPSRGSRRTRRLR